jgi:tetratricopeptide (TPR) repeat protein
MRILCLLFLGLASFVSAQVLSLCDECLNDEAFIESIAVPFHKCLQQTMLTRERLTQHYELRWKVLDEEWGYFSRSLIPYRSEELNKYSVEDDEFDIRFCEDYRKAISLVYVDLDFLHRDSKFSNLKNIAEQQQAISKSIDEIVACNKEIFLQIRERNKKAFLAEIDVLEKANKRRQEQIALYQKWIVSDEMQYAEFLKNAQNTEKTINEAWFSQLDWCVENHDHLEVLYERGMLHFCLGETFEALCDIRRFLETVTPSHNLAEEFLFKGRCEVELGLYKEAVLSLSKAIERDPSNKEAYFERAAAYLELGCFEESLFDYVISEIKPKPFLSKVKEKIDFAQGLHSGCVNGAADAVIGFVPSLLDLAADIASGLWTFAESPIEVSSDFVDGAIACAQFIKNSTALEKVFKLVPELQPLILDWDKITPYQRGEIMGRVIGKYGVEIFAARGVFQGIKACRDLKRASNLLTLESAALSETNRAAFAVETARRSERRVKAFASANLKIEWDKQGKHIIGHRNYVPGKSGVAGKAKSVLQHPDPQKLAHDFAGTGMKANNVTPGIPGYQEIVNFGEVIGYEVDFQSGKQTLTTWGKIHYAKNGVHIVPTKPRG